MLEKFEAYQVSLSLFRGCKKLRLSPDHHDQLLRASSSITLNLAEGSGKPTPKDKRKFYAIAFGSLRECQAILELNDANNGDLKELSNRLGAMLFKLTHRN